MLAARNPLVIQVWSTILYQPADLGLNLGQNTITNHYHRGEDRGIDLGVVASVAGWVTVAKVM